MDPSVVVFKPRIPHGIATRPDGSIILYDKGLVFATVVLDLAIFHATVVRRGAARTQVNIDSRGKLYATLHVDPRAFSRASAPENKGYVYVFRRKDFKPSPDKVGEFIAPHNIRAIGIFEVTVHDLTLHGSLSVKRAHSTKRQASLRNSVRNRLNNALAAGKTSASVLRR
jgi:hypothetical protein